MDHGWIKLHRKTLKSACGSRGDLLGLWLYLLLNATYEPKDTFLGDQLIKLKPGQLVTGRKVIAREIGYSEGKIQRLLKMLEDCHQIEQHTNSKGRVITITNWDKYQTDEQPMNNVRSMHDQCMITNKKKIRNKEDKNSTRTSIEGVSVPNHVRKRAQPYHSYQPDPDRVAIFYTESDIEKFKAEGFSSQQIKFLMDGLIDWWSDDSKAWRKRSDHAANIRSQHKLQTQKGMAWDERSGEYVKAYTLRSPVA